MFVKSVIAGTVLSLMAGGVVYFGTDVDTVAVKETVAKKTAELKSETFDKVMAGGQKEHPHSKKTEKMDAESSTDRPSVKTASGKLIEAKKPTVSQSSKTDDETIKTVEVVSPEKPQKKWLNQYLKTDTPENDTETPSETEVLPEDKADVAKDLMESMGLTENEGSDSDTGSFIVEEKTDELTEEKTLQAEAEEFEDLLETENVWTEDSSDGTQKKLEVKVIENEDGKTTIETETIDMGDGKIMKIVKKTVKSETKDHDGKKMRIKIITDEDDMSGISAEDIKVITKLKGKGKTHKSVMKPRALTLEDEDISGTVKIVMQQAKMIEMPELRDRAYLELVSYALTHGDYDVASNTLDEINQVDLRDTARNRIAIAYAKDGNAANAFGILEDIEVDALRDTMRLQVIEAMIAPEKLSEDMH